jgi:adenylate cyclase
MSDQNHLAVLFADVTGSTSLYHRLGNEAAKRIVDEHLQRLVDITRRYDGVLIKTIGDEIMCSFADVSNAARAAGEMQMAVKRAGEQAQDPDERLRIQIGFHFGKVIEEGNDIFGDTVNVAARMVGMAKPEQILLTRGVVNALPEILRPTVRFYDQATVKGKLEHLEIFELIWEVSEATMLSDHKISMPRPEVHSALTLRCAEREVRLDRQVRSITLGRSEFNGLQVANPLASRQHALIEFRRGRFVLIDQSVNGTYLQKPGGENLMLKREEYILPDSGLLSLGEAIGIKPEAEVEFHTEHA